MDSGHDALSWSRLQERSIQWSISSGPTFRGVHLLVHSVSFKFRVFVTRKPSTQGCGWIFWGLLHRPQNNHVHHSLSLILGGRVHAPWGTPGAGWSLDSARTTKELPACRARPRLWTSETGVWMAHPAPPPSLRVLPTLCVRSDFGEPLAVGWP